MANQTKKKKSQRSRRTWQKKLPVIVFGLLFAGIATYILFRSFAATNTSYNLAAPPVGIAASGTTGDGYWIGASDGGVFSQGTAVFHGSMGSTKLNEPVVGIAATHDYGGYYLVARDGGLFAFGDAASHGSLPGLGIVCDCIVGMAETPDSGGYWMAGSNGSVYSLGNATFEGSSAQINPKLARGGSNSFSVSDIVGIASSVNGGGYWLVGADGGIFAFGNAPFAGSLPSKKISVSDIVGIVPTSNGQGYWLVGADGGVFAFGNAVFYGSMSGTHLNQPVVGMAATNDNKGYWLVARDGGVFAFGDAQFEGRQVYNPPTASLTASTTSITAGQSVTLNWQTTNAQTESITGIGPVSAKDSAVVKPTSTTTYTLSAVASSASASSSVTIHVTQQPAPISKPSTGSSSGGTIGSSAGTIGSSGGSASGLNLAQLQNEYYNGSTSNHPTPSQAALRKLGETTTGTTSISTGRAGTCPLDEPQTCGVSTTRTGQQYCVPCSSPTNPKVIDACCT